MEALNDIGVPCGAVLNTVEVLEDPHLRGRGMVVDLDDESRGRYPALGCPIKVGTGTVPVNPPPLLGEHSEEVLSTLLGMDREDLDRLTDSGVI
jgi:formyl-CoA transferase